MKRILALTLAMVLVMVQNGISQTLTPPTDNQANTPVVAPIAPVPKADGGDINGDSLMKKYLVESMADDKLVLPGSCKNDELTYINAVAKAKTDRDLAVMALDKKRDTSIDVATKAFLAKLQAAQTIETKRGNLEGALAIKARIEKMNPISENKEDQIVSEKYIPLNKIFGSFSFPNKIWKIENGSINGTINNFDSNNIGISLKNPIIVSQFEYGFKIKAKWYHAMRILINNNWYTFSRGHWNNTGTWLASNEWSEQKLSGIVNDANAWCEIKAICNGEKIKFIYNDIQAAEIPITSKPPFSLRVGFDSHQTTISVKDFILRVK